MAIIVSLSNFVKEPSPGDKVIYIYDINDNVVYTVDPYSSTFYNKSKFVYILTDGRIDYNNMLQFGSESEALQGIARLDEIKRYFANTVTNNYVVKVSDNDIIPDVLINKISTGNTILSLNITNTGSSEKLEIDFNMEIALSSPQMYDYFIYDGTQWVNSAVTINEYFYNKTESDAKFVKITGDTMTGDLTLSKLTGVSNRLVFVDNNGKIDQTEEFVFKTTNTSLGSGTNSTDTFDYSICKAVSWDYVIDDSTNFRAGTIIAVWNGSSVQYNEICTNSIGTISDSTFSFNVVISGSNIVLNAIITSGTWSVSTSRKMIG